uniref:ZZ-type domain-containing protein n=1 Tax=Caenorhabditis tropicalis TaxID=1561998 RepID=A0A1I7UE09_9PELO
MEEERKLVPPEYRNELPLKRDYGMPLLGPDGMAGGRPDIFVLFYSFTAGIKQVYMKLDFQKVLHQITQKVAELFPGTQWLLFSGMFSFLFGSIFSPKSYPGYCSFWNSGNRQYRNAEFKSDEQIWEALEYGKYFDIRYLEVRLEPADNKHKIDCNNCKTSIIGHRFQCLECTFYSICARCEEKSVHAEHAMLRIVGREKTHVPDWINDRIIHYTHFDYDSYQGNR